MESTSAFLSSPLPAIFTSMTGSWALTWLSHLNLGGLLWDINSLTLVVRIMSPKRCLCPNL